MNDYERNLFHGECPFNGKKCDKDIDCIKCKTEHKERRSMMREDTISRETVLDAIRRISLGQTDAIKVSMMIEDYVKRIPSIQYQEGKWIMIGTMTHECSICGRRKDTELKWNYCPHCGARMEDELQND